MKIERVLESDINGLHSEKLQALLSECFPDFLSQRSYYKQLPHFRYLGWEQENLVAQMGVDHRVVSVDGKPFKILGVIDLCVAAPQRQKGFGRQMLEELEKLAKTSVDFMVLFADDHRLYEKAGFARKSNTCKWVGIHEHQTGQVIQDSLADCLMIKEVGSSKWPDGNVDLMGCLF